MNRWAITKRPYGTKSGIDDPEPSDKSLGYYRTSLRDAQDGPAATEIP